MANKNKKQPLLNEGVFRRFGQLAGTEAINRPLLESTYGKVDENEETLEENEETLDESQEELEENAEEQVNEEAEPVEEVETKEQARARGDTDRLYEGNEQLNEMPEEDEMPPMDGMGGDEELPPEEPEMGGGMEGDVEELVQAIADAITTSTGVEVDVEGGAPAPDMGGEEELPMDDMGGDDYGDDEEMMEIHNKLTERGYKKMKDGSYKKYQENQLNEAEELDEDAYQEKKRGKPSPGSHENVQGADKGTTIETGGDPATKDVKNAPKPKLDEEKLEEALTKRVMTRILKEFKARSVKLSEEEKQKAINEALAKKKASVRKSKK